MRDINLVPWVPADLVPPPNMEVYILVVYQWGFVVQFGTVVGEYNHDRQRWEIDPVHVHRHPQMAPLLWTYRIGDPPPAPDDSDFMVNLANKYRPVASRVV